MSFSVTGSIQVNIEALIGSVGDNDLITNAVQSASADVINAMPHDALQKFGFEVAITTAADGVHVRDKHVLSVHAGGYEAKQVSFSDHAKYNDSTSIYGASDTDPVYYINKEFLFIQGNSGSGKITGTVRYVPIFPITGATDSNSVINSSTTLYYFPRNAQQLICIGGAIYCLNHLISDAITQMKTYVNTDEDVELANAQQGIIDRYTALKQSLTQDYNLKLQIFLNQDTHERSQAREGVVA